MSEVAGFIIAPASSSTSTPSKAAEPNPFDAGAQGNQLYALGTNGSLTIVSVTEGDGGTQSSMVVEPLGVFNLPSYVLLAYSGVTHDSQTCQLVLARKSDGALFCISGVPPYQTPLVPYTQLRSWVETDATGNLVWLHYSVDGSIQLLNLTNPDDLTVTQGVQTNVGAGLQAVNAEGDDLLMGLAGNTSFTRVLFPTGGFFNVTADSQVSCPVAGSAADPEDFYYTDSTSFEQQTVHKLTPADAGTFTDTAIGAPGVMVDCNAGTAQTGTHVLLSHASTVSTSTYAQFIDVANDVPSLESAAPLVTMQMLAACDTTAFIVGTDSSGNSGIVAYDPQTATVTTLLTPGEYTLSAMDVASSCEVTFYGQRSSDGAFILGNVPAGGGAVTIIATGFPSVTQIQRIN
jgi:hypothetical protein